ncbi:MAG: alpha/beta fold hydrolase [Propionibacteriales bacterium]|nr:alpha/beta fold hydrolase [Propionibacteriales bacterium]
MIKAVLVVAAVVILLLVVLWSVQRRLIYFPSPETPPPAASALSGARDVVLQTSDGLELGAWFVPATGTDRGVTVLVANGNAGDRSGRAPLARALSARGLSVLLFDYRGYGGNPGSPSEEGLARDVRAAHRYLVHDAGVDPDRVLYFGESLGSAVVTELATEHPPGGLVLRSPFVDLASVGRAHYPFLPVGTLLRDRYPLRDHLMDVHVPTVVVYGARDSVVPADQSREVARSAPRLQELVAVQGADHNDPALLDGRTLIEAVVGLADEIHEPS